MNLKKIIVIPLTSGNNYMLANKWRLVSRKIIQNYHLKGYTTIAQVMDKDRERNLQIMAKNFDPFNPPNQLLA